MIIIFILSSTFLGTVKGYSYDQGQCYCFDNRITCIGMTGPKFRYRVNINILYMEHVQILDFDSIIKNLPNLEYLTMMNMRFFRCHRSYHRGLIYIQISVSYSTSETTAPSESTTATASESTTAASYWTSTGEYFTDILFSVIFFSLLTFCVFLCPFGFQNILLHKCFFYLQKIYH